ncbi:hypothetical protein MKQ70_11655 [Chitinophaga sedimenti]|uniref:hypothetical protein n=1 Tax=Chitinophaga sedimenti TaxID=2033606 RepID=UPI002004F4CD|nr:hypothetical protein [Chitinophaga sedimenti]MCK7555632.1 hypothetical protein [Chitinophaga sedimenti]
MSARLTIAAFENAVSAAERRALINNEKTTHVRVTDLLGIVPAITGKIELVYEGEQEGPLQVAVNLVDKSIRSVFAHYFPNPDSFKREKARPITIHTAPSYNGLMPVTQYTSCRTPRTSNTKPR